MTVIEMFRVTGLCLLPLGAGVVGLGVRVPQPHESGAPVVGAMSAFTEKIAGTAVTFEMLPVPAGEVELADPTAPGRSVKVKVGPLLLGKTEVTWDMYDVYANALDQADPTNPSDADAVSRPTKPYLPPDRGYGHGGYAAISIASGGAREFCAWLSRKTGRTYRLATEAEWEYACRAGATGEYGFGEASSIDAYAWHKGNAEEKTHPVGSKKPNAWGLHDMHGNVAEWVIGLEGKPLLKGGSFQDGADKMKVGSRSMQDKSWNANDPQVPKSKWWLSNGPFAGFRIVCEPGAAAGGTKDAASNTP
ncbi:MAG: formylglycine-generating enzyme family protein [Phycisphaerae bacterium]|nr:formylglycine-generating enzyme family protein [Phycisphaerae bacterium]